MQIDDKTQKLASYIGETILNSSDYTRRNPLTISAAAMWEKWFILNINIGRYLAATLEDVKITQADICKVTGLTGVTLRKVYKELLSNVEQLLPKDYVPPNMGLFCCEKMILIGWNSCWCIKIGLFFMDRISKRRCSTYR